MLVAGATSAMVKFYPYPTDSNSHKIVTNVSLLRYGHQSSGWNVPFQRSSQSSEGGVRTAVRNVGYVMYSTGFSDVHVRRHMSHMSHMSQTDTRLSKGRVD